MNVSRPYADVIPGPRGALLATLVQLETPVTVRALARHAAISPQGALHLVNELSTAGLVLTQRAGNSLLVSLNRQHLAAQPLVELIGLRSRLVERLQAELSTWPLLAGAWLFGSVARGDGAPDSDVDLLLVAEDSIDDDDDWSSATANLAERVGAWTGNQVQLVEHTRQTFANLIKTRNSLIHALSEEGIPLTSGTRSLLRGAS